MSFDIFQITIFKTVSIITDLKSGSCQPMSTTFINKPSLMPCPDISVGLQHLMNDNHRFIYDWMSFDLKDILQITIFKTVSNNWSQVMFLSASFIPFSKLLKNISDFYILQIKIRSVQNVAMCISVVASKKFLLKEKEE